MTELRYLDFEYSDDGTGVATLDALASVGPGHVPGLLAELTQVLGWAHQHFAHACAPLDEGGLWDYALTQQHDDALPVALAWNAEQGALSLVPMPAHTARWTVSLTISASAEFCEVFALAFEV